MDQTTNDIGKGPPRWRRRAPFPGVLAAAGFAAILVFAACSSDDDGTVANADQDTSTTEATSGDTEAADDAEPAADIAEEHGMRLIDEGRDTFRNDTFGSEGFFGGVLQLHDAIQGEANGGFGGGVSPETALAVGLKVDVERLPDEVQDGLAAGEVDLTDTATTLALLRLDAVVGVDGQFGEDGTLTSVGVTCALCHSTVDDSFAPGVGKRLDGWANRDLNVGAILNLAPDAGLQPVADMLHVDVPTVRTVLQSWGPGKYDATVFFDGKAFRPDGETAATLIPNAYGLAGSNLATWTGWGSVTHWNALVSNLEMHGSPGTFFDPRLDNAEQFPIAAEQGFGNVRPPEGAEDRITGKLAALHVYQLSIPAPAAPEGSFDAEAAERGEAIFAGEAGCATCHVPPLYTEPGFNAHTPDEIGIDSFQADRSPAHVYRTTPLAGAWRGEASESGYYHDGRFKTLLDVVNHYDQTHDLGLTEDQKADLVEFLKSL